jgi:hypothetical protein
VQPPPVQTRVVPANALFHFALPQREYAAVLAAVQYFARKLQAPSERMVAESALTWLQNISGMTLPSEAGSASASESASESESESLPPVSASPAPAKGLASLKGAPK